MSKVSIRFFEDKEIRAIWDEQNNKWFFNIVDMCAVLSNSVSPSTYWRKLKQRLKTAGDETVTKCHAFKFTATDAVRTAGLISLCLQNLFYSVLSATAGSFLAAVRDGIRPEIKVNPILIASIIRA